MKLIGKYYVKKRKHRTRFYIIRKTLPLQKRRILIFGPSGYGKSCYLIRKAIIQSENILYISTIPFECEWGEEFREVDISVYKNYTDINPNFTGKVVYDFGLVPQAMQLSEFIKSVVPYLVSSGITSRKDVTVVLDNLTFLTKNLDRITKKWKCKVIVDWTCSHYFYYGEPIRNILSRKWKLVPVFTPLWKKV